MKFVLFLAAFFAFTPAAMAAEQDAAPAPAPVQAEVPVLSKIAPATSNKYIFDKAHTQVIFSALHLGFSHSHGRFMNIDGSFTFDEAKPEDSAIDVTIDANSIDMGSKEWDDHLKKKDFLNVEAFPTMTFKSTKAEKTGEKTGKVTGDFTLLGVTKPLTLDVTYNGSGAHPYSNNHIAGFSATATIKRSEFGMTYGIPGVSDDVSVIIQVEGIRQDFEQMNR